MACLIPKVSSKPRGSCAKHFQQKCEAVLRWIMRGKKAFPAKVRSGFALDNARIESISSERAKRFCVGQCADRKHFQQKCEAVLRWTMRAHKTVEPFCDSEKRKRSGECAAAEC